MVKSTSKDAQDLFRSIHSAYSATPTNLKVRQSPLLNFPSLFAHPSSSLWNLFSFLSFFLQIIDLYVVFAVFTALIQVRLSMAYKSTMAYRSTILESICWNFSGLKSLRWLIDLRFSSRSVGIFHSHLVQIP